MIIHGSYGHPKENWFPWLKEEQEKIDCRVFVPKFPTPKNQSLENWLKVFENYEKYLNEDTILVGHSLGPAFILTILEKLDRKIKAAFFVSGFISLLNNKEFDELNKTFVERKFNWEKIKQNCTKFIIYHSDNDPYVPLEKAKELAESLDTEAVIIKGAGHFNENSGYKKFEILLKDIKKILK